MIFYLVYTTYILLNLFFIGEEFSYKDYLDLQPVLKDEYKYLFTNDGMQDDQAYKKYMSDIKDQVSPKDYETYYGGIPPQESRNEYGFPVYKGDVAIFKKKIKTIYLCSPYSHKDKKIMNQREKEITRIAAKLLDKHHVSFFLPITQSAPLARANKRLKGDFETWKEIDLNEVALRDETWVVAMSGWKESIGVQAEIEYAKKLGKPLKYINPYTLNFTKRPDKIVHGKSVFYKIGNKNGY